MMKFLLLMIFLYFKMKFNKILSFYFNLMYILFMMMLMNYYDNMNMYMLSIYMGMDYYSYMLFLLSIWVISLMYMCLEKDNNNMKSEMFLFMLIILFLFFSMMNMLLFYFFFELSLIPTFMLIIYWGYNLERLSAAYYMLMYTLLISLPLLVYLMYMYKLKGSFNFDLLIKEDWNLSFWGYLIVMGSFFVKMPMYMFHIWLPKAHVEAPVYGSMILAAILLKLGGYGLIRFLMIFMKSSIKFSSMMISLGIIGSLIISLICLMQIDLKSLVAYSSVVHMNLMMCSLMSFFKIGFISAYMMMIAHGLCSSGLFYMVNLYYYRTSSRLFLFNKGMINLIPSFTLWWFFLCCSNFSFPLSFGFIGEIYFLGMMIMWSMKMLMLLIMVMFISSAYSLYMYLYIQHGELNYMNKFNSGSMKEYLTMIMHYLPLMLVLLNLNIF